MAVAKAHFDDGAAARVEALLRRHRTQLHWIARRWSGSAEDAEDALQRALEIYLRRLDSIDPATELAWLKVVVRHEAMAIRRARAEGLPLDGDDVTERLSAPGSAVDERAERDERMARSLEALARIKPDERTALLLKAQGFSYKEIGERLGWTYTKVNRAITEGRRRFLGVFASIESGEECERFAPTLLALVQGAAAAEDVIALRPHLRHCAGCRATVRELHASRRHRLALHIPFLAGVAPLRWLGERLAGGQPSRPLLHGVLQRLNAPDAVTGMQLAAGGGGRGTAVAALVGLCLGGGAGSYCIATGGLPDPTRLIGDSARQPKQRAKQPAKRASARAERAAQPPTAEVARRPPAPTPTPMPQPVRPRRKSEPTRDSSSPRREFGFEGSTGSPGAAPAASPPAATAASTSSTPPSPSGGSAPTSTSSPPPTSGGEFLP